MPLRRYEETIMGIKHGIQEPESMQFCLMFKGCQRSDDMHKQFLSNTGTCGETAAALGGTMSERAPRGPLVNSRRHSRTSDIQDDQHRDGRASQSRAKALLPLLEKHTKCIQRRESHIGWSPIGLALGPGCLIIHGVEHVRHPAESPENA